MSAGEILFMVLVVAVAGLMTALKDKVPSWLGFVLMLAASVAAIIGSAATKNYKAIPLGVAGVVCTIIAWVSGATSKPQASDDTLGGVAEHIPGLAWVFIAVLMLAGFGISFAIPSAPPTSHTHAQLR
jgi:hypothetical protein